MNKWFKLLNGALSLITLCAMLTANGILISEQYDVENENYNLSVCLLDCSFNVLGSPKNYNFYESIFQIKSKFF